ncbi:MAG: class I SAM-dependent methyltransferase [Candidatus Lokiarchaeota archaeon]|nr:class I SAM-dependent methyltransferase [Candidatus Lokiarchaeota archaeon]
MSTMPDWDDIFAQKGKYFTKPHPDMERLADLFIEKDVHRILDLGCGTGRHLIFLLKKGFEVYGLDGSPNGLEITKKWLIEENLSSELICQQIEHEFPYKDSFFDAVISIQVLHHNLMKDILFTVREIKRTLKPEGFIFITFPIFKGFYLARQNMEEVEKRTFIPLKGPEKGLPHHFFTVAEIKKVFNAFDLSEIYIDTTNHRAILGQKISN